MSVISVKLDESLWATSLLPEGVVERWFVEDGGITQGGHRLAEVRIEGALHDVVSPATGRLNIYARALHVIEPGSVLATIEVPDKQS
jgi:hypothetical protein